jgi:hypothetical protein
MDKRDTRLQTAFMFDLADLGANRAGRLSPRQQARLAAARSLSLLAMVVFAVVMLGTGGILIFSVLPATESSGATPPVPPATLGLIVGAVAVVLVAGLLFSRRYLAALSAKPIRVAQGPAAIASARDNNWQLQVGPTVIRVAAHGQLAAFRPGVDYRVYYLAGPVANILSAETATATGAMDALPAPPEFAAPDPILAVARAARLVLILLGVLALEIPIAAFASAGLPPAGRWWVIGALLVQALAFVGFALWRLLHRP